MSIEPLPSDVRSYLRSGVAITSVTQCVEELVLNSLDAGATCVAVRVDLNCFKVQVVDNGSGVPNDQLEILGNRFCTSKCHTLTDLSNLCHFGYRGEALASIRESCGVFEITTRSKLSSKTYCKIYQNGKSLKVAESTIVRPCVGTTITVHDLFSNFPVRQKAMNKNFEIERIREMLEGIALIRPGISFTLRNDSTGQVILSTRKCVGINSTFGQLYGTAKVDLLVEVRGSKQGFHVQGYIGREGHPRKNLQFVYVNGRLVKKSRIHKLLNRMLLNLPALKQKSRVSSNSPQMFGNKQNLFSSPPKFSEAYPVFILEIKCPISDYDITFEPAKTMVEFKDWDTVLGCVEEVTKSFLDKENIVIKTFESSEKSDMKEKDEQNVPVISADNMKDVMSSKIVKKLAKKTNTDTVLETQDGRISEKSKGDIPNIMSTKEGSTFKTPANIKTIACQAVIGLGKRKLGVESDTEDNESEIENSGGANENSSTDESNSEGVNKGNGVLDTESSKKSTTSKSQATRHNSGNNTVCSLSKFRQSIGKFTAKPSEKINIDESLKKFDRIMPSSAKQNRKTLFSSLQKFRRKVETSGIDGGNKAEHDDFKNLETGDLDKSEEGRERLDCALCRNCSRRTCKGGMECIDRNNKEMNNHDEKNNNKNIANGSADKYNLDSEDNKVLPLDSEENQRSSLSDSIPEQFKFSPCFVSVENVCSETDMHMSDINENESFETEQTNNSAVQSMSSETNYGDRSNINVEVSRKLSAAVIQNIPLTKEENEKYNPDVDDIVEHLSKHAVTSERFDRKRSHRDSDLSPGQEKHFRYSSRPLDQTELKMDVTYKDANCDIDNDMCNKDSCDVLYLIQRYPDFSEQLSKCDRVNYPPASNEMLNFNTDQIPLCIKPCSTDRTDEKKHYVVTNEIQPEDVFLAQINGKEELNDLNGLIGGTQAFSPRLSPPSEVRDENQEKVEAHTPESLGFTPKLQVDTSETSSSTGLKPTTEIEGSIYSTLEHDNVKSENFNIDSMHTLDDDIEHRITISQHLQHNNKVDVEEVVDVIEEESSDNKMVLDGTNSESVTLTQLLITPSQKKTSDERYDVFPLSVDKESDTEVTVAKRKGFSFGDLFSQTPKCSTNVDTGVIEVNLKSASCDVKADCLSKICSDCDSGTTDKDKNSSDKYIEIGDNIDVIEKDRTKEFTDNTGMIGKKVTEDDEKLWTDSPWDISDSSFYLREEIQPDEKVDPHPNEQSLQVTGFQGENKSDEESSRNDAAKVTDEDENFYGQGMNTLDRLNDWYQNLDAGISGSLDILQSKKPSDVVRKLHECRFSKESLKSVQVLGQLDKKFIACLINTEQQCEDTDTTMLVLIDQHAAHERIRLEILTEDAFHDGVKGGQLATFDVDPPYSMIFAEHEVRTIISFQDEYLRLGIKMKEETPTSVLISSVPASLVDREKNSKIYWSTIQVLIREHISVFMSTRVSFGVLPQTIHKVLCSLACHGAIKFGDKLAADECARLIKDLSRCDLPFQCAHGRPSVTPLFHMDKLQTLSHSKKQAKPKLWKLHQALKK